MNQNDQETAERMQQARDFVDHRIQRDHPNSNNIVHINFQGLNYHFYSPNAVRPSRLALNLAVRSIRNELEPYDHYDSIINFHISNGSLAASVTIHNVNIDLENFATAHTIYCTWLYFGDRHPRHANIMVMLR